MALPTYGTMAVDWEQRVNFDRLRRERLERAKKLLAESSMGALLCFDMNNVRYITATYIGTWAQDKNSRLMLLLQNLSCSCRRISDPPQNTTACIATGWASARRPGFHSCAA